MEPKNYTVTKIEGEYAYLTDENENELFIALALLPFGTDVGTRLRFENFIYTIIWFIQTHNIQKNKTASVRKPNGGWTYLVFTIIG